MEMVKTLTEKLEKLEKPVEKTAEEKEKIDEIFKKRGLGKPAGCWESKRQQYFKMLNEKKIAQPKQATLDYYKIFNDSSNDRYVLMKDWFNKNISKEIWILNSRSVLWIGNVSTVEEKIDVGIVALEYVSIIN